LKYKINLIVELSKVREPLSFTDTKLLKKY